MKVSSSEINIYPKLTPARDDRRGKGKGISVLVSVSVSVVQISSQKRGPDIVIKRDRASVEDPLQDQRTDS